MKARYLIPLVDEPLPEELPPQLRQIRQAGSRNSRRIGTLFKSWTPTSCRIITWMQEKDYNKQKNCGRNGAGFQTSHPRMRRPRSFLYSQEDGKEPYRTSKAF